MDILNGQALSAAVLLLLILYPCELWDPPPPPPTPAAPATLALPADDGRKLPAKPRLQTRSVHTMEREAFLRAFERQAGSELMPCLRAAAGETGSLTFMARLSKGGTLSGTRVLLPQKSGLECAVAAINKMYFSEAAAQVPEGGLEISWRFDW